MNGVEVVVVRVYATEGKKGLKSVLDFLHDETEVRGVTVFRGIMGYGRSHKVHAARLTDLSLDLPVVVEFFETPEAAAPILERLRRMVPPGHLLNWRATVNEEPGSVG